MKHVSAVLNGSSTILFCTVDMDLEHLGRGTTEGMDQFIVVMRSSVQTYRNVLAEVVRVVYKIKSGRHLSKTEYRKVICFVHYNPEIMNADREGVSPDFSQTAVD